MSFPFLSFDHLSSHCVAGLVILALPAEKRQEIRITALVAGILDLVIGAGGLHSAYNVAQGGYQFVERYCWVQALGISYYVGVDGISVPLVLLGALVVTCGVMISWKVEDTTARVFCLLDVPGASVQGVFCSLDLFMLFFFFELAVFPKYLMIAIWGYPKDARLRRR